jgi:hypothetical protein
MVKLTGTGRQEGGMLGESTGPVDCVPFLVSKQKQCAKPTRFLFSSEKV